MKKEITEKNLMLIKNNYQQFIETISIGYSLQEVICDERGNPVDCRILEVNSAFEEITGLKRDDLVNKTVLEIHPGFDLFVPEEYGEVALTGKSKRLRKYSKLLKKHVEIIVYRPEYGRVVTIVSDITEKEKIEEELQNTCEELEASYEELAANQEELRNQYNLLKEHEELLHKSRQRLASIIDFLPDATYVIDREKKVIIWNKAIEEMTGIPAEKMIGKGDYEYALPFYNCRRPVLIDYVLESLGEIDKFYDVLIQENDTLIAEVSLLLNGETRCMWCKATPLYDSNGNKVGAIESIRDITKRKQLEIDLRLSEERFRNLVETADEIIYSLSLEGVFTFVSPQWKEKLGHEEKSVEGKHITLFLHPDDAPVFWEFFQKVVLTHTPQKGIEYRLKNVRGEWRWYTSSGSLQKDHLGKPVCFVGVASDITKRKQTEEALRRSEQRAKFTLECSGYGAWEYDLENNEMIFFARFKELLGYREDEELENNYEDFLSRIHPDDLIIFEEKMKKHLREEIPDVVLEYRIKCKDGNYKWVLSRGKVLTRDKDGKPLKMFGTLIDVHQRKIAEEKLRYLSLYDSLTGLYNRGFFEEEFRRLKQEKNGDFGIIICDVDGMKKVNDDLGHDVGDALLRETARVLKSCFQEGDILARIGGDEFAVLLENGSEDILREAVLRIKSAVAKHNKGHPELPLSISVGFSTQGDFKEADNNMYKEKLNHNQSRRSGCHDTRKST